MASLRMTLLDLLNKSEQGADPNFLRDGVQLLAQELMDAEVTDLVGAEPHQRTAGQTTYRNVCGSEITSKRAFSLPSGLDSAECISLTRCRLYGCLSHERLLPSRLLFWLQAVGLRHAASRARFGGGREGQPGAREGARPGLRDRNQLRLSGPARLAGDGRRFCAARY
jgi:hypothetical protein